ncbi:MAG: methionyl-tRNA formyltransferase [Pyrinomonadaceae bacterium]
MKVVFMGTPQAAVPSLEQLLTDGHDVKAVYTQPDRPSGRGNKITFSAIKEYALQNSLAVFQPEKIKTIEALETFKSHDADAAIVVAYGRILPETILNAFPMGSINVHFSLLPKYRGAAPVNWAIVRGEKVTGVTTMRMDAGLDTGDILLQSETAIGDDESAVELMNRLSIVGSELLAETILRLHEITPRPQNNDAATLAPLMKKEDGLLSWNLSATEIANRVRGFQPFPSAHLFVSGKKLTLWKANKEYSLQATDAEPGRILAAKNDDLLVVCGSSSVLRLKELQLEGKRRMSVRDFLNGVKLREGDMLN